MRLVRLLSTLAVIAALGWSGWWYALALGQEVALRRWFSERREAGWQADYGALRLAGFPLRVSRRIEDLALADPSTGWAWTAPAFRIDSHPLDPARFTLVWPTEQLFAVPGERVRVASAEMRADLAVASSDRLPLRGAALRVAGLRLEGESGWRAEAGLVAGAVTRREGTDYEIDLDAEKLTVPGPLLERLDPAGVAGGEIERVVAKGSVGLDRPLDLATIEHGRLAVRHADIRALRLEWGALRLEAKGRIEADARGYPEGEIDVSARYWREIITMLERGGVIGPRLADSITSALTFVAGLDGDPDSLDGTLRFAEGRVWFGPVPLAAVPRIARPR